MQKSVNLIQLENEPSPIYYVKPNGRILEQTYGLVRDDDLRAQIDELMATAGD